jgi:O-succinylbenzoate synthase
MTFTINKITMREIRMTLREPFQISSGSTSTRRIMLLQLEDADGVTAWSECVAGETPNYSPETIATCWIAIEEWIAPKVLGREFADPGALKHELDLDIRGHNMAKAAVEMGAWALEAERKGVSLSNLLGGTRDSIGTGISLGIQPDPATLVKKAGDALALGYRKVKLKIKPGADLEYVAAVREALGDNAPLMVDANNAFTVDDFDHLVKLDDFGLVMIEQPLAWDDVVKHAGLQKLLKTPICLDESITGVDKAEDMLALGSGRIINIKPARVGGFTESKAIHDLCEREGVPVWCGGMLESGVGRAHNVALASLPNFKIPGDISPSARYWEQDIVTPEWTMDSEGMVAVPKKKVGIGVEVDVGRVEGMTVKSKVLS